jgi:hypothetical protein
MKYNSKYSLNLYLNYPHLSLKNNILIHTVKLLKRDIKHARIMYKVGWGTKERKHKKISNCGTKLMNTIAKPQRSLSDLPMPILNMCQTLDSNRS